MPRHTPDITGRRFGRLLVKGRKPGRGRAVWECQCECGQSTESFAYQLESGAKTSCGCWSREQAATRQFKHGGAATKLYKVWQMMRDRCSNAREPRNVHWLGRGIKVCDAWQAFEPFRDWALSRGYAEGLTIDRVDNDGDYSPENCEFVTRSENSRRMHASHAAT